MLRIRLWLGEKIFGLVGSVGARVSPHRMIKWNCEEPELEALRFAAANTNIPVPRLYRMHRLNDQLALEMEFLSGCATLQDCWRNYTIQQKQAVVDEIGVFIKQLRKLEPPDPQRISSTSGGACRDIRVGTVRRFGPFADSAAFHRICFTHGDLAAINIFVRDAKVVAIIDWECAGWYPEYWEYTKAHYNSVYLPEFYEMLRQRVDRYDGELEAERVLWQRMNQPLDDGGPSI
ncbi:hypothetical protein BST61_g2789 [Cercospora zeina]